MYVLFICIFLWLCFILYARDFVTEYFHCLHWCLCGSGKLCLQHEELVQKYLPVFARELEVGTEVAVRNNVVVIMCDLCVRYTNIVDHYIPNISACLRDNEAVIREQTLVMLTNLLQVGTVLHILHWAAV